SLITNHSSSSMPASASSASLATHRTHRAAVLASIRPGDPADPSDVERWVASDALLADAGIELLEWFVISDRTECPREFTSEPARWRP
ncbi:MAG: hypothetical protein AAFY28_20825, partial [Actinomycetota bacterium]